MVENYAFSRDSFPQGGSGVQGKESPCPSPWSAGCAGMSTKGERRQNVFSARRLPGTTGSTVSAGGSLAASARGKATPCPGQTFLLPCSPAVIWLGETGRSGNTGVVRCSMEFVIRPHYRLWTSAVG